MDTSESLWKEWDISDVLLEIPERNFVSKLTKDEGGHATSLLSIFKADGLTMEQIQPYYNDPYPFIKENMPDSWQAVDIDNQEGLTIRHWTFNSIFPQISNREAIQSTYLFEEDGWKYQLHTSFGNEYLEETLKDNLGEH